MDKAKAIGATVLVVVGLLVALKLGSKVGVVSKARSWLLA